MTQNRVLLVVWFMALTVTLPPTGALTAAPPPPGSALLVVEKPDGLVTATELQAFKNFMRALPPPTDNIHNNMVYGSGGTAVEAMGRMVEISGDPELLDRMICFADAMLAARNDPQTGVVIWTGQRDLIWPNAVVEAGKPASFSTENGDVVGHITYAAELILQNQKLADAKIPDGDPHGYGATYHQRAVRYVQEMDRTIDGFISKWLVKPDTLRYYSPNSPLFEAVSRKPGTANRPVPWNQQAMLNNGFQRLAECHTLLGDDPARVQHYQAIVKASVDWFFARVQRVTVKDHVCYQWAYPADEDPIRHVEDAGHGSYDILGLCRAYRSSRYGLTAAMMQPFANTVLYAMRQPDGKFARRVDGTTNPSDHPPGGLNAPYLDLCEFAPELFPIFYDMSASRIPSSPELTAAILWHRHRRAMARN